METMMKETTKHNSDQREMHDDYAHSHGRTVVHTQTCLRMGKCIQTGETLSNQQLDHTATGPRDFSNFRVEYIAPTKPEHTFEPRCWIVADSATYGEECRVFDVPDPDESQREVAEFACRAMNGFEALVGAARTLLAMNNCNYDRDQMRRSGGFQQLEEAVAQVDVIRCSS
jgi:hypothetical protein